MTVSITEKSYDVVIVGAGPAGCACALELGGKNLRVALVDKEVFPREKVCGDALGRDVVNQMKKCRGSIFEAFSRLEEKIPVYGFEIRSPSHHVLRKYLHEKYSGEAAGYVMRRELFDEFMLSQVQQQGSADVYTGTKVETAEHDHGLIRVTAGDRVFTAAMVVAADGMGSIIRLQLMSLPTEQRHDWMACRGYFRGIDFMKGDAALEFHFLRETLPGYLWIFPSVNKLANIGLGMPIRLIRKKKINLKDHLLSLLKTHPFLKDRFSNTKLEGEMKAYPIPMYHRVLPVSGEHFLLAGDAASLVNPLTGEGIGNAIRSGRIAADHISKCFEKGEFSASFNRGYDGEIYARMGRGLRLSLLLQKALYRPWLMDTILWNAARKKWMGKVLLYLFERL